MHLWQVWGLKIIRMLKWSFLKYLAWVWLLLLASADLNEKSSKDLCCSCILYYANAVVWTCFNCVWVTFAAIATGRSTYQREKRVSLPGVVITQVYSHMVFSLLSHSAPRFVDLYHLLGSVCIRSAITAYHSYSVFNIYKVLYSTYLKLLL